jgi:hypothetical protein
MRAHWKRGRLLGTAREAAHPRGGDDIANDSELAACTVSPVENRSLTRLDPGPLLILPFRQWRCRLALDQRFEQADVLREYPNVGLSL